MSDGRFRPRPTSTRVPTRERTIWWQKALASISKASRFPTAGTRPGTSPIAGPRGSRCPTDAAGPLSRVQRASTTRRLIGSSGPVPGHPAAEGPEVVLPEEGVGCRGHGAQVEGVGHLPGQPGQQWVGHRGVDHQVAVAAGGGRAAGVEPGRRHLRLAHHHRRGQLAVARPDQGDRDRARRTGRRGGRNGPPGRGRGPRSRCGRHRSGRPGSG